MGKGAAMDGAFEREVRELHVFLEDWFVGRLPDSDAAFAPFAGALSRDFVIVSPRGVATRYEPLCAELRAAHAFHADPAADFRIRIQNCRVRFGDAACCLGTYEEWQHLSEATTARLSTVLFRRHGGARSGLQWHHLHETWLAGHAPPT